MAAEDVVTLGIGSAPASLTPFTLVGLSANPSEPFTATFSVRDTLNDICSAILETGYVAECEVGQPDQISTTKVHAAVWVASTSVPEVSLSTTSDYYLLTVRFYRDAFAEPTSEVELDLARAVSSTWVNWLGDFDAGSTVRNIDVAGIYGQNMSAVWGHESVSGRVYRVADITLPLIVNDIGTLAQ